MTTSPMTGVDEDLPAGVVPDDLGGGTTQPPAGSPGGPFPEEPVDDDSWASPREQAGPRLKIAAGVLAALLVGTIGFSIGAKVGKDRAGPSSPFGGNAAQALARLAGGGGGFRTGDAPATTAATAATETTSPNLGGLLPGLDVGSAPTDTSPEATTLIGTITAVDGATLTVADETGAATAVTIGDATVVERTGAAALAPLATGAVVTVEGTTGPDGVLTATKLTVS